MKSPKARIALCWTLALLSAAAGYQGGARVYAALVAAGKNTALQVFAVNAAQQLFVFALPALLILCARPARLTAFRQSVRPLSLHTVSFSALLAVGGSLTISLIAGLWAQLLYALTGYVGTPRALPAARGVGEWLLAVVTVAAIPAFAEELFFRGLIQTALCKRLPRAGLYMAALIFAAAHLQPEAFGALFLLGIVLGALYRRYGYLSSALLHALYNAVVLVLSTRAEGFSLTLVFVCVVASAFALRGLLKKEDADEADRSWL